MKQSPRAIRKAHIRKKKNWSFKLYCKLAEWHKRGLIRSVKL